jgi:hypothetical protein
MLLYQLTLRSGPEKPDPCRECSKLTRGIAVVETGDRVPLCPKHLNNEHAARFVAEIESP